MRCPIETQENLELLLDASAARLKKQDAATLAEHLEVCSACREFVAGQQGVWAALDAWEAPDASAGFDARLYRQIERAAPWWRRLAEPLRPLLVWHGVPAAAAACMIVTAGIVIQQQSGNVPQSQAVPVVEIQQPEQVLHALDDMDMLQSFDRSVPPANSEL
jgi:hypothetical protein